MTSGACVRVHIIGGGGSGKTTIAQRFATTHGLPHVELGVEGVSATVPSPEGWVTEGIFLYGTRSLLDAADAIVWLDLPCRIARRSIYRHTRLTLTRRNRHRGFGLLRDFLRSQTRHYTAEAREKRSATDWAAITRARKNCSPRTQTRSCTSATHAMLPDGQPTSEPDPLATRRPPRRRRGVRRRY